MGEEEKEDEEREEMNVKRMYVMKCCHCSPNSLEALYKDASNSCVGTCITVYVDLHIAIVLPEVLN